MTNSADAQAGDADAGGRWTYKTRVRNSGVELVLRMAADSIIDALEARLNAAIEASSIAEAGRLDAEARAAAAEAKAALADEAWGGTDDEIGTWEAVRGEDPVRPAVLYCRFCQRKYPNHAGNCRKARYDALTPDEGATQL